MAKLAAWANFLVPLTFLIISLAVLDQWMIANGLETHLEAGRSIIWLMTLLIGVALTCGIGKMRVTRQSP